MKIKTKIFSRRELARPRFDLFSRPSPMLYFLFSRRLETKTLVSRTTSL